MIVAPPIDEPMTVFIRRCVLFRSSLKQGKRFCPQVKAKT